MKIYVIKVSNGEIVFATADKEHADSIVKNNKDLYIVEEEINNNADEEYIIQ